MLNGYNKHPKNKMSIFLSKYLSTKNRQAFFDVQRWLGVLYAFSPPGHTCDDVVLSPDAEKAFDWV